MNGRTRVYRYRSWLKQFQEFFHSNLTIAKNLEKQSGADGLTGMYRHDGCPSVFMTQKVMAPLSSQDGKPDVAQRRHKISAGDPRPPAHAATVMR